jgi:sugar lactone lactonase YvrE
LAKPGPLAASSEALYAFSGGALVRVDVATKQTTQVIATGACDARGLAIDAQGRFLITDGTTHTLRVFDRSGKPVKQVGTPGGRYVGSYEQKRLVDPRGVAVASNGWVWIAEDRLDPKRVSAWDLSKDAVVCEKFGTPAYGGSGAGVDPSDHTRWIGLGCEWKIDVTTGMASPTHVLGKKDSSLHFRYVQQFGQTWVVAIQGTTGIYRRDSNGSLTHVAEIGQGHRLYHYYERKPPQGYVDGFNRAYPDRPGKEEEKGPGFLWLDRNGDGNMQSEEFEFSVGLREFGGGYWGHDVAQDLTVRIPVEIDGKRKLLTLTPSGVKDGLPQYPTIAEAVKNAVAFDLPHTQMETWPDLAGNLITNTDPVMRCFAPDGKLRWTYPNRWSNVHGSHNAPLPETGVLQGVLFNMGIAPLDQDGDVFVLVGNHGRHFALSSDGLYLDEFFKDVRMGGSRDANYVGGESFGGNFVKSAKDGKYYLQANSYRVYRIDGLDRVTRSTGRIDLTQAQAIAAERVRAQRQAASAAPKIAGIPFLATAPTIDGKDDEWKGQPVLEWDRSGQFKVSVSLGHDGTNLYVVWRVQDPSPWVNTGKDWTLLFKTGDSVDLQIGTDANANPKRSGPVPGDLRLLIAPSEGQNLAVLYRHRVPGAKDPVTFTCPWRAEKVDEVKKLASAKIAVTTERDRYRVELAVPLADLGLNVDAAPRRFDVGTLFGDPQGTATSLRSYWSNQNTGLVSDVPGEIMLFPNLWGTMTMGGKP